MQAAVVRALIVFVSAGLCGSWGLNANPAEPGIVRIGVLLPPEEPQLQSIREGIQLAQIQLNQRTNGSEVMIRGREGQWGADAVEAARLVTDEGATGLIAPPGGAASHLVLQVSGRTATPVITLCADGSVGRTGVPWLMRLVPSTEEEAKTLFSGLFTSDRVKQPRWVAVVPDQRSGREIGGDLRKAARVTQCELSSVLESRTGTTNFSELCVRVRRAQPQGILVWLQPRDAGAVVAELRDQRYAGLLAGPGWLQCSDFFSQAGGAAEQFVIPSIRRDAKATERWKPFAAAYTHRWDHQPDLMAGLAYDAVLLLSELLQQEEFRSPPHSLPPDFVWAGVTGDVSFDAKGDRKCTLELLRVDRGRFVAERP